MEKDTILDADQATTEAPELNVPPADIVPVDLSPIEFTLPSELDVALRAVTAAAGAAAGAAVGGWIGAIIGFVGGVFQSDEEAKDKFRELFGPDQPTAEVVYAKNHPVKYRGGGRPRRAFLSSTPIGARYAEAAIGLVTSGTIDLMKLKKKPVLTEADAEIPEPHGAHPSPTLDQTEAKPEPTLCVSANGLRRIADTLVSGRKANADWRKTRGYDGSPASLPFSTLAKAAIDHAKKGFPSAPPISHRELVLIEARLASIDHLIRAGGDEREELRARLGWIVVDSESDRPSRPVNVSITPDEHHEMTLDINGGDGGKKIHTRVRYVITHPSGDPAPSDSSPILFLHGHSSRIEETDDLRAALADLGHRSVALDLPGFGYSKHHEPSEVEGVESLGEKGCVPFLDRVVSAFVHRMLDQLSITQFGAVCGGSLGGNLVVRQALLAASLPTRPFKHHIAWSVASLWDIPDWKKALTDVMCGARIALPETSDARREYFHLAFVSDFGLDKVRQANEWYRDDWELKDEYIDGGWLDRHEIYSTKYRRWHWQIAREQVKSTEVRDRLRGGAEYANLVLMAGKLDNGDESKLYDSTRQLADEVSRGKAYFWEHCGHSIHNEYPRRLASLIDEILKS